MHDNHGAGRLTYTTRACVNRLIAAATCIRHATSHTQLSHKFHVFMCLTCCMSYVLAMVLHS